MDAKDLRTESSLGARSHDGSNKYSQSAITCNRNKSYHDVGTNSLGKVDIPSSRPCAVIGPDRVVPPPAATEAFPKKPPPEQWMCADTLYRRPPEYPNKMAEYQNQTRNISPRQTFQENMQRILVPPTYNSIKMTNDSNLSGDGNLVPMPKNSKVNVPTEVKYCDVPYNISPLPPDQKTIRDNIPSVSAINQSAPYGWPGSPSVRPPRPFGAPELYQYQDYPGCATASTRSVPLGRPVRNFLEETPQVFPDRYYTEANMRYKPYPHMKEGYPQPRYDCINNYPTSYHPPPYPPPRYEIPKPHNPHLYSAYTQVPVKYFDNRMGEAVIDGYQRSNPQPNYNVSYPNQFVHPTYGPVPGNCLQNKLMPFPPEMAMKGNPLNKLAYENKMYADFENSRNKPFVMPENYYGHKGQIILPKSHPPNIQNTSHPYYRKDYTPFRNYDPNKYPELASNALRFPSQFSPNIASISSADAIEANHLHHFMLEDSNFMNHPSVNLRNTDPNLNRIHSDLYARHDYKYGPIKRTTSNKVENNALSSAKERKNIDVRQFLQQWNDDDENNDANTKQEVVVQNISENKLNTEQEQLYVLGSENIPSEELSKYEHIQKISKLPDNIKGYNSLELLNQFEEAIESSNMNTKPSTKIRDFQGNFKTMPVQRATVPPLPRPISPLDVEAKISQSVIHKEVGCNFEIKPCSPKMLSVEIATPVKTVLNERVIEKLSNPLVTKSPNASIAVDNLPYKGNDTDRKAAETPKNSSCNLLQFDTQNYAVPSKTNYSLTDLESSSGVCLASLPRLDNEIELNFPEVNQQFINANTKTETVITALHSQDLSPSPAINKETVIAKELNPKEFEISQRLESQKLCKYRKSKKDDLDYSNDLIDAAQSSRTDSVIIKNPDTVKESDCYDSDASLIFNDLDKISKDRRDEIEKDPIALDFSVNKYEYAFGYDERKLDGDIFSHPEDNSGDVAKPTDNITTNLESELQNITQETVDPKTSEMTEVQDSTFPIESSDLGPDKKNHSTFVDVKLPSNDDIDAGSSDDSTTKSFLKENGDSSIKYVFPEPGKQEKMVTKILEQPITSSETCIKILTDQENKEIIEETISFDIKNEGLKVAKSNLNLESIDTSPCLDTQHIELNTSQSDVSTNITTDIECKDEKSNKPETNITLAPTDGNLFGSSSSKDISSNSNDIIGIFVQSSKSEIDESCLLSKDSEVRDNVEPKNFSNESICNKSIVFNGTYKLSDETENVERFKLNDESKDISKHAIRENGNVIESEDQSGDTKNDTNCKLSYDSKVLENRHSQELITEQIFITKINNDTKTLDLSIKTENVECCKLSKDSKVLDKNDYIEFTKNGICNNSNVHINTKDLSLEKDNVQCINFSEDSKMLNNSNFKFLTTEHNHCPSSNAHIQTRDINIEKENIECSKLSEESVTLAYGNTKTENLTVETENIECCELDKDSETLDSSYSEDFIAEHIILTSKNMDTKTGDSNFETETIECCISEKESVTLDSSTSKDFTNEHTICTSSDVNEKAGDLSVEIENINCHQIGKDTEMLRNNKFEEIYTEHSNDFSCETQHPSNKITNAKCSKPDEKTEAQSMDFTTELQCSTSDIRNKACKSIDYCKLNDDSKIINIQHFQYFSTKNNTSNMSVESRYQSEKTENINIDCSELSADSEQEKKENSTDIFCASNDVCIKPWAQSDDTESVDLLERFVPILSPKDKNKQGKTCCTGALGSPITYVENGNVETKDFTNKETLKNTASRFSQQETEIIPPNLNKISEKYNFKHVSDISLITGICFTALSLEMSNRPTQTETDVNEIQTQPNEPCDKNKVFLNNTNQQFKTEMKSCEITNAVNTVGFIKQRQMEPSDFFRVDKSLNLNRRENIKFENAVFNNIESTSQAVTSSRARVHSETDNILVSTTDCAIDTKSVVEKNENKHAETLHKANAVKFEDCKHSGSNNDTISSTHLINTELKPNNFQVKMFSSQIRNLVMHETGNCINVLNRNDIHFNADLVIEKECVSEISQDKVCPENIICAHVDKNVAEISSEETTIEENSSCTLEESPQDECSHYSKFDYNVEPVFQRVPTLKEIATTYLDPVSIENLKPQLFSYITVNTDSENIVSSDLKNDTNLSITNEESKQHLEKRSRSLKRSLSESDMSTYEGPESSRNHSPNKRKRIYSKRDFQTEIIAENIFLQNNRRNSFSTFINEENVSFCILLDDNCIITEECEEFERNSTVEESESFEYVANELDIEDNSDENILPLALENICTNADIVTNFDPQPDVEGTWIEDVACVETVVCDNIAEDIEVSNDSGSDYDSNCDDSIILNNNNDHADKVKHIYEGCHDNDRLMETLYRTPQMDVNRTLVKEVDDDEHYVDQERADLENMLSESMTSTKASDVTTLARDSLIEARNSAPHDNNFGEEMFVDEENHEYAHNLDEEITNQIHENDGNEKTQYDIVHSCESSFDNVFSYNELTENTTKYSSSSSSPEVSSTTSEEKCSSILLKITSYNGSIVSEITNSREIKRISCKYTEKNDYNTANTSSHRPLLTKGAQKYIPPISESIKDLKVQLPLPQHSLLKLQRMKLTKDSPKSENKINTSKRSYLGRPNIPKKPKPKFEDVLKSIDEIQFKMHKEKTKKVRRSIPKVVIKKNGNGSHYTSSSHEPFDPDLTGRKWQPWVFIERNCFIDKMANTNRTEAIYSHRKKEYVFRDGFRKYKSISSAKFVITQPKLDDKGHLKYTIKLKHNY